MDLQAIECHAGKQNRIPSNITDIKSLISHKHCPPVNNRPYKADKRLITFITNCSLHKHSRRSLQTTFLYSKQLENSAIEVWLYTRRLCKVHKYFSTCSLLQKNGGKGYCLTEFHIVKLAAMGRQEQSSLRQSNFMEALMQPWG